MENRIYTEKCSLRKRSLVVRAVTNHFQESNFLFSETSEVSGIPTGDGGETVTKASKLD